MFSARKCLNGLIVAAAMGSGVASAGLEGTAQTQINSWDDGDDTYRNSNSAIVLDGQWHPFFSSLSFDTTPVDPSALSNITGETDSNGDLLPGPVQCSTVDTDGNGLIGGVGATTRWAGILELGVDHIDTGSTIANGFRETRCWELAICDREGDGQGTADDRGDATELPRFKRFTVDVAAQSAIPQCPTSNFNTEFGYVDPAVSNGFITLLEQDEVVVCDQKGRCDNQIQTTLFVTLDRDCDGAIDDADGSQVNNDPSEGDLSLIGQPTDSDPFAGRIPLPIGGAGGNVPEICFFAEGKKPDFTISPQWTGNIQARITASGGTSGDKTINHSIISSPVVGDVGDAPESYGGVSHITNIDTNPFLGTSPDNNPDFVFTQGADGDDLQLSADEDGVVLPGDFTVNPLTATVTATNLTGNPAMLCGWFDFGRPVEDPMDGFSQNGIFDNIPNSSTSIDDPNAANASTLGERSCVLVPTGTDMVQFPVTWTLAEEVRDNSGTFYFRFRISDDPDMFNDQLLSPTNGMETGEVEDFAAIEVGSLPVSIASFRSRATSAGLELEWSTVSETHNIGFNIWGTGPSGLQRLNAEMIPADGDGDALMPRRYKALLEIANAESIEDIAITAVDQRGKEEMYGLFNLGVQYGERAERNEIAWQSVRQATQQRKQLRLAAGEGPGPLRVQSRGGKAATSAPARADYADVRVTDPGMQSLSWQDLASAGLDLSGIAKRNIAVTLNGQPVARQIIDGGHAGGNSTFGPGDEIRFWGRKPDLPDALYLDDLVYRVVIDADQVRGVSALNSVANDPVGFALHWDRRDDDVQYSFSSSLPDPWSAVQLRADRRNRFDTTFNLDDGLVPGRSGRLAVLVGGVTDFPADPDHHVRIEFNGHVLGERFFEGDEVVRLELDVPPEMLLPGANTVTVLAPGGSSAPFDLFRVDTVELGWPRRLQAVDDRLLVEDVEPGTSGLALTGFSGDNLAAYALVGEDLTELRVQNRRGDASVATRLGAARYWISATGAFVRPVVTGAGAFEDLLAGRVADLVVVAHPAFLPVSSDEPHPLNDYVAQRRSEGWQVEVFDITEIQAQFGHGMALPEALTAFLRAADQRFAFEHVLLVGGDSYDYTDNLGMGSISFIPTRYTATRQIPHSPSDGLLADLDGDGLPDKALGRWPVRTQDDLSAIVAKTLDWPEVAANRGMVWVTDSEDSRQSSFSAQAERMIKVAENAGWSADPDARIFWADVQPGAGQSVAAAARARLFETLENGRALTGFVGHGAPTMWTFQGLLRPNDLDNLFNEGNPTLIGTLTCYTSYFVSPFAETVAHRWMNGFRTGANGVQIPGVPNGAVAIHGAATLSDIAENEVVARAVYEAQLAGMTLGQAVEQGRQKARSLAMEDVVKNWTLLGDPTLRLHP